MEERKDKTLSYKLSGLPSHNGFVRFPVFEEKLGLLKSILSDAERQATSTKRAKSLFLVTKLECASAAAELAPFAEEGYEGSIAAVDYLSEVIANIDDEKESLGDVQSSLVKKLKAFCKGHGETYETQILSLHDRTHTFDQVFEAKAQRYLDKKHYEFGDIKGRIERVNIHDRSDFFLYPEFGDGSVTCHFNEDDLLQSVRDALGKTVIISGRLEYIGADIYPTAATVDGIDVRPDNYKTPDLFGIAKGISDDTDVSEYVKGIRGEWERH